MAPHAAHEKRGMVTIPLHPYGEWRRDLLGDRLYAHVHTTTGLALECYLAFGCGKNCMIFTNANVFPWVVFGAALADDDITGNHRLAAELFDA